MLTADTLIKKTLWTKADKYFRDDPTPELLGEGLEDRDYSRVAHVFRVPCPISGQLRLPEAQASVNEANA